MLKNLLSLVIITLIATSNAADAKFDCAGSMATIKLAMATVKDLNTCPDA
jgi:hypothetical protein